MKLKTAIAAAIIAAFAGSALAQTTPRVDQREANQQQRIEQARRRASSPPRRPPGSKKARRGLKPRKLQPRPMAW